MDSKKEVIEILTKANQTENHDPFCVVPGDPTYAMFCALARDNYVSGKFTISKTAGMKDYVEIYGIGYKGIELLEQLKSEKWSWWQKVWPVLLGAICATIGAASVELIKKYL